MLANPPETGSKKGFQMITNLEDKNHKESRLRFLPTSFGQEIGNGYLRKKKIVSSTNPSKILDKTEAPQV